MASKKELKQRIKELEQQLSDVDAYLSMLRGKELYEKLTKNSAPATTPVTGNKNGPYSAQRLGGVSVVPASAEPTDEDKVYDQLLEAEQDLMDLTMESKRLSMPDGSSVHSQLLQDKNLAYDADTRWFSVKTQAE